MCLRTSKSNFSGIGSESFILGNAVAGIKNHRITRGDFCELHNNQETFHGVDPAQHFGTPSWYHDTRYSLFEIFNIVPAMGNRPSLFFK